MTALKNFLVSIVIAVQGLLGFQSVVQQPAHEIAVEDMQVIDVASLKTAGPELAPIAIAPSLASTTKKIEQKTTSSTPVKKIATTKPATAFTAQPQENQPQADPQTTQISTEMKLFLETKPEEAQQFTIYKTPPFPDDANLNALLLSLRATSYSSNPRPTPPDPCDAGTSGSSAQTSGSMHPSPGIYFTLESMRSRSGEYKDISKFAEIHAYDSKGGHYGLTPSDPSYPYYPLAMLEDRSSVWNSMNYAYKVLLSMRESDDARIVIKGKKYDILAIQLNGEGNSCGIVDDFYIQLTPYTVITIPFTLKGDIGPIAVDINGDGTKDLDISLKFKQSEEQSRLIESIARRLLQLNNTDPSALIGAAAGFLFQ